MECLDNNFVQLLDAALSISNILLPTMQNININKQIKGVRPSYGAYFTAVGDNQANATEITVTIAANDTLNTHRGYILERDRIYGIVQNTKWLRVGERILEVLAVHSSSTRVKNQANWSDSGHDFKFILRFPYWQSFNEYNSSATQNAGASTQIIEADTLGNAISYPIFQFSGVGISNISINLRDKKLVWGSKIPLDIYDVLEIDTRTGLINNSEIELKNISDNSSFSLTLLPDVGNVINFSANASSTINISYRKAWHL